MLPVDTVRLRAVLAALRQIHEGRTQGDWALDHGLNKVIQSTESETLIQAYYVYGDKERNVPQAEANARSIVASVNLDMEMIEMVEGLLLSVEACTHCLGTGKEEINTVLCFGENWQEVACRECCIRRDILSSFLARATVVLQGLGVEA